MPCDAPVCQLLGVNSNEAEEADHHDGDEAVQDVIPAVVRHGVVAAVDEVGEEKAWGVARLSSG